MVKCTSTKGKDLVGMLMNLLKELNLDPSKCIGNSTDSASNMQGEYNRFSIKLSEYARKQIHIWCFAHVLNLVILEVTQVCVIATSLFQLMNGCAVFIQESHKRMDKWTAREGRKRLHKIGETRWWSKHTALSTIFGYFDNPKDGVFVQLVLILHEIQEDREFKPDIRCQARGFLEALCKYETVLCAQLFLRIFEKTTPFSKYLQTKGIDLLKVHRLYQETVKDLEGYSRDFNSIQSASENFVTWANTSLEAEGSDIIIANELPKCRTRRKKKMFDYEGEDETATQNAMQLFEYSVHNLVLDRIVQCMKMKFEMHGKLCADFSCLDPRNFDQISENLPNDALKEVYSIMTSFILDSTLEDLQLELKDFSSKWKSLKKNIGAFYKENVTDFMEFQSDDELAQEHEHGKNHDEYCISCVYTLLLQYNLYSLSYPNLERAYKVLLTLSITQVSCERCFSKLKIIKNRLRSTLTQEHVESFMIMSCEKDILVKLSNEEIINRVAQKSKLLTGLLCF